MIEFFRAVVAFIVVLGVLVTVHELGHYLVARWRGVAIETFSVGFGPALLSRTDKHGTVWKLSAIPLGGYVRMKGWAELGGETKGEVAPDSFRTKSLGSRAAIVAAGPAANMVLAFVLFSAIFATSGAPTVLPVVSQVMPHTPAAAIGIVKGDRITSVDGQKVSSFEQIERLIAPRPDDRIAITYTRDGVAKGANLTTASRMDHGQRIGELGIVGADVAFRRLSPPAAMRAGAIETYAATAATLDGLWKLVAYQKGVKNLGGPIRIAQISGKAASLGLADFVSFIALLSLNLGLINLIPIPILDGGHLLFYAAEGLYGRALPRKAQEIGLQIGAAILASLIVFVTWHDLAHVGLFHFVSHLLG
ncbi:RIP metalloprotease RseP [Acidiphilium acidophilum]|uniref:Zinc metalloprotease n=1 Tax=Acidiphilium acidophilum TaxID=76588 RepID=A0AAW9DN20_ACIAO|nr:RIP metalloprotease RseP [Acidiphilium acidophilum]MDX5929838.1 RIP metalloprotease RseP [Acidiphilium acidophilum]GBR77087.1 putative peptidase M50 [Acidiphilium acidophilum DSM 700]